MPESGIVTDRYGRQRAAMLFTCDECRCAHFLIYQISGQDHFHLQCTRCGTSFCQGRSCNTDPATAPEKTN
jgi:Fe2+ or Zn2+ uptake regulation protein